METRGDKYQGNFQIGQKVYSILYGGKTGIISAITGEQSPGSIRNLGGGVVMGGRAEIDIVFDEYISRGIPEAIIRGVQWFIYDDIKDFSTPDQIKEALDHANAMQDAEKEKEKKEAQERTNLRASLPAEYPHLVPATEQCTGYVLGAKNIRIELKRAFPGLKFSVRSESYSGGCSINIGWTDGPLTEEVKKISNKYQEGSFDGMTDCYDYNRENVWPNVFGGAKYVFENRHESADLILRVAKEMNFDIPTGEINRGGNLTNLDCETSQRIYRQARQTRG